MFLIIIRRLLYWWFPPYSLVHLAVRSLYNGWGILPHYLVRELCPDSKIINTKEMKLYVKHTCDENSKKEIQSILDEIGLEYGIYDISNLDASSRSDTEEIVLSDANTNNSVKLVGKDEILEHLNNNYQSKSWRTKEKISDVVYHIADAVFEFI